MTVIGSGESGPTVPHPEDPNIVYHLAQSTFAYGGGPIQRVNLKTGQWEHVNVWPMIHLRAGSERGEVPLQLARADRHRPLRCETLYTAAEVVFRSRDRGSEAGR